MGTTSDACQMPMNVSGKIAVIDSEIDAAHPDLEGAVTQRYDAVGTADKPHPHGTGMAGAIGAHQRLLGTAPAARLLAVHAFSTSAATAESTTFNILKGLDYAVNNNVRIVKDKIADYVDPPRVVPLIGPVQLHHAHYKCTIYYTETVQSSYPFPAKIVKNRVEVVYIDKDHLHAYVGCDPVLQQQLTRDLSGP